MGRGLFFTRTLEIMTDCDCGFEAKNKQEKRTLVAILVINASMFFVEFGAGIWSHSTGLTADSLDMLADAFVYSLSLYAVGRAASLKSNAALFSGIIQILLGIGVIAEVIRRVFIGNEPMSEVMFIVGGLALIANSICVVLLAKHRNGEVHLRASWIFTTNDVIVNAGVMLSGVLVWLTSSAYPDLLIGFLISAVVIRGGIAIVRDAKRELYSDMH